MENMGCSVEDETDFPDRWMRDVRKGGARWQALYDEGVKIPDAAGEQGIRRVTVSSPMMSHRS